MKRITIALLVATLLAVAAASKECPGVCPLLYGPVCGYDEAGNQKTFDNMCLYNHHNCKQRKDGLPELTSVKKGMCV